MLELGILFGFNRLGQYFIKDGIEVEIIIN
jgi:hypothetical protein